MCNCWLAVKDRQHHQAMFIQDSSTVCGNYYNYVVLVNCPCYIGQCITSWKSSWHIPRNVRSQVLVTSEQAVARWLVSHLSKVSHIVSHNELAVFSRVDLLQVSGLRLVQEATAGFRSPFYFGVRFV